MRPEPGPVARLAAAAIALGVLVVAWQGLLAGVPWWHTALYALCAPLPTLAVVAPRGPAVVAATSTALLGVVGISMAARVSPWDLVRADGQAWGAVRALWVDGVAQAGDAPLPADIASAPALVGLLELCLLALCFVVAWQLVVRCLPVGALVALGVGLGYRWTVVPPEQPVVVGVGALAAMVAVLALCSWRPGPGHAWGVARLGSVAIAGLAVAGVAWAVATGPVRAEQAWLDWRSWGPGPSGAGGSVALDIRQQYGTLDRSAQPREVLEVAGGESLPLRAAALEAFDGEAFAFGRAGTRPDASLVVDGGAVELRPLDGGTWRRVRQRVTLVGGRSALIYTPGRTVRLAEMPRPVVDVFGDTLQVAGELGEGTSYVVEAALPVAGPGELRAAVDPAVAYTPSGMTALRPPGGGGVNIPLWGSASAHPADSALGPYAQVRQRAREIAADAPTQYDAVNRIEAHLRRSFDYHEQPPPPAAGRTAIEAFLFDDRVGFCQHFAGAMGVMLRSLGIPTRLAVGYGTGRWNATTQTGVVTDRDAHTWVEVWFPGHGWVPFDPTPGRSVPGSASVSSPDYAGARAAEPQVPGQAPLELPDPPASPAEPTDPEPVPPTEPAPGPGQTPPPTTAESGGGSRGFWVAGGGAVAVAVLGGLAGRRPLRRRMRSRRGDARQRLAGAVAEFEGDLLTLGVAQPRGTPTQRAAQVGEMVGLDATRFYARIGAARFGPQSPDEPTVRWAWQESDRLGRRAARQAPLGRRLRARFGRRATVGA